MAFYSDDRRREVVVDCLRRHGPMPQKELYERIAPHMQRKTGWKALCSLEDDGMVVRTAEISPTGHKRFRFSLEDWYAMTDEQRERMVTAMESIAESMREQTEIMRGKRTPRETKEIHAEESR